MPRKKADESGLVFVNELPGIAGGTSWASVLAPLVKHPERWALVREFDTAKQAMDAQSNLHRRLVNIPQPNDEWSFAARGCELYACYRGRKKLQRSSSARIRRAK